MPGKEFGPRKVYLSIVEGTLRQKVDAQTKNAVAREYEMNKNGVKVKAIKHELIFMEWGGIIKDIRIKDTEYGQVCEVEYKDAIITIPTESRYFQDFVQKVMSANLAQTISFHPYDFEGDDGKQQKGVSMEQNGKKLTREYYYDKTEKKSLHGFPQPVGDTKKYTKDDWKIYFLTLKKFLIGELETLSFDQAPAESYEVPTEPGEIDNSPIRDDEIIGYKKPENTEDEVRLEDVPF